MDVDVGVDKPLQWQPDRLGPDYEYALCELGPDPDGESPVCAAVVRHHGEHDHAAVMVHGMSDYFFHDHVARYLHAAGIRTYAVDLRKCGRALRTGQTPHYASDMRLYREDLEAAVQHVAASHSHVSVMAHSTGALAVAEWLAHTELHIDSVVYNSPWLEMLGPRRLRPHIPRLSHAITRVRPQALLRQKPDPVYGESLHRGYQGEWDYDLRLKPLAGFPKRLRWLRAVAESQRRLARNELRTSVPSLVLTSERSSTGSTLSDAHSSDVVLDVADIWARAPHLSTVLGITAIPSAMHDVYLSPQPTRTRALEATVAWIRRHDGTAPLPH
ncbi:Alpha/beta hydrolase family protein [Corynebacterium ciconiae DSM 44920]|nr:alpha/beta hydrolase [Corynebacterium ciconiae]WKD61458.1 Alpha/beta hydrolase family protein [Corynebacterium ciconiae DSM 44920]